MRRGIESQSAQTLRAVDVQQDAARAQKFGQLGERRREAGVVIHRADDDQARSRVHGIVEPLPGHAVISTPKRASSAGRIEIVREFVLERQHAIAGTPVESREQQPQRGGRIRNERDVVRARN